MTRTLATVSGRVTEIFSGLNPDRLNPPPLIPAKAGTQSCHCATLTAARFAKALGPGFRRDERTVGVWSGAGIFNSLSGSLRKCRVITG